MNSRQPVYHNAASAGTSLPGRVRASGSTSGGGVHLSIPGLNAPNVAETSPPHNGPCKVQPMSPTWLSQVVNSPYSFSRCARANTPFQHTCKEVHSPHTFLHRQPSTACSFTYIA